MSDEMPDQRSVTLWLAGLQGEGLGDSAQHLWHRYFERLVYLARARLRSAPKAVADEEDVALSAFDSFCRGAAEGRFPKLEGRDDLWRLLVSITVRKAQAVSRHERRLKRGGGRVVDEAALGGADWDGSPGLAAFAATHDELDPAFAAEVADEFRRLLNSLDDDLLRQVALLRMEGYSNEQVAERLGCGLRSVERKLALIRKTWEHEAS